MRYCSIVATAPQITVQGDISFTFDPDPGIQVFLVSERGIEERNPHDAGGYWNGAYILDDALKDVSFSISNLNAEIQYLSSAMHTVTADFKNISIA